MKKLRSKHGFTIVEVLVAFVIFAIMAGMVSMILAQVNRVRQQNNELEEEIRNQKEVYYLKDQSTDYDSADKSGELSFKFEGMSEVNIDYNIGDPNAAGDENLIALEYFIGDVNYDATKKNNSKEEKDETGNNVGSVTTRLDSRVYGSTGISNITAKITRDESYTGTGYRYFIKSMATYTGLEQQEWFAQYRFIFPSVILDYGYTQQSDNPSTLNTRFDVTTLQFEVYSPYNRTLRISSKQSSWESTPPAIASKYLYYYVVLAEPLESIDPDLDMNKIFGYSDSDQTSTKTAYGSFTFEPYVETIKDDSGNQSTATYPNIFGAFPKPEEETEDSETSES